MDDRAITHIGATAREAVLEVAIRLEVITPGFAPECFGDQTAVDDNRQDDEAFLAFLLDLALGLTASLGDGDVGPESVT